MTNWTTGRCLYSQHGRLPNNSRWKYHNPTYVQSREQGRYYRAEFWWTMIEKQSFFGTSTSVGTDQLSITSGLPILRTSPIPWRLEISVTVRASYFFELHYAQYSIRVLRDVFIFHMKPPSTWGDKTRKKKKKVNMVCIQYFLAYLTSEYGAGYLGDRKEVFGWHIWKFRRPQGISYDTWGDAKTNCLKMWKVD